MRTGIIRTGKAGEARTGKVKIGWEAIGMALQAINKENNMKADELKALRKKLGLSVTESARIVQVSDRSWQRYESGDRKIPNGIVELFCLKNSIEYKPEK